MSWHTSREIPQSVGSLYIETTLAPGKKFSSLDCIQKQYRPASAVGHNYPMVITKLKGLWYFPRSVSRRFLFIYFLGPCCAERRNALSTSSPVCLKSKKTPFPPSLYSNREVNFAFEPQSPQPPTVACLWTPYSYTCMHTNLKKNLEKPGNVARFMKAPSLFQRLPYIFFFI